MDENRPVNPRRRPRSKLQLFKEAYLPVLIAGVAILLILIFIIGSISRAVRERKEEIAASIEASNAASEEQLRLETEAQSLLQMAEPMAAQFDYPGAIATLESFSGSIDDFPLISEKYAEYKLAQSQMIAWNDPSQVLNLSFQLLVAETERTFNHPIYATLFNRNFITTGEFSKILQQLYDNGYILVNMDDFIEQRLADDGTTQYVAKTLYLPAGKKPLMITQTNVNYNIYLIDSDGDRFADKEGGGFASRMVLDANGEITCEMVDSSGQTVTGDFDLVPILNNFVKSHPDFSYRGAKATLALTGYNGLFGYRTTLESKDYFGVDAYNKAVAGADEIANKLLSDGYKLACYTYANIGYGESGVAEIEADLNSWNQEVVPILGQLDTLVFAQNSDIESEKGAYGGNTVSILKNNGFTKYIGFCDNASPWTYINGDYLRQGRILVSGTNLAHKADMFSGIFDAASVLDTSRGDVPV